MKRLAAMLLFAVPLFAGQPLQGSRANPSAARNSSCLGLGCAPLPLGFSDHSHYSKVFGEMRKYRIFLPVNYESSAERYPVIYYFHGHSDRYTLEKYDNGLDTVPKIEEFVAGHGVIVVAADGYVARDYTGFYGGTPYDVMQQGGDFDFGAYFLELVRHIDSTYRTLSSRRYRATSGLSMGGFMSLYLSARYPGAIGSASAFNPGPEFYVGEKGRRSLWRPKDHVLNHERSMLRLIRASGDYISQYTEETRAVYARTPSVDFEFRQDEYHRHWATSIGETFAFHMRAFANPALDTTPVEWNYTSAFRDFSAWNYHVEAAGMEPGFVYLKHVTEGGLGIFTRRWAPDGPSANCAAIHIATAPLYRAGAQYRVTDYDAAAGRTATSQARANDEGRLEIQVNCDGHEVGFSGPGAEAQPPVLLLLGREDAIRVLPGRTVVLPIRIFNPRDAPLNDVRAELTSEYPTVEILGGKTTIPRLAGGQTGDLSAAFQVRFTAGAGDFAHARLNLKLTFDGTRDSKRNIDVLIAPDPMPAPLEVVILDGRTKTFPTFRQKGNQGGGSSIQRTVTEGKGNGDGSFQPGEQATIWVKNAQGRDPADKNNWCRAKVYSDSPWLQEAGDIQEQKGLEWTSAKNRTSLLQLSSKTPPNIEIPMILDCESWSFSFTPDVRYGTQLLYQAFQLHQHNLFRWQLQWKNQ
ncbi:MAG: alpha/beta hydrolase-fold protein [Bryobacteraceae bacterium]